MISIAIDGPAGVGKSTVAKEISKKLGFIYVDTGAFYRTIALFVLKNNIDAENIEVYLKNINIKPRFENGVQKIYLNGEDVTDQIRFEKISMMASKISAIPEVRNFLLTFHQDLALKNDVVMDGRDIGTVVLPQAELKIFLIASVEERALRRFKENTERGIETDLETLKEEIAARDFKDSNRAISPLKAADDAITFDTTGVSIEGVVKFISEKAKEILDK